jgi:hypothetical protein
MRPSMGISKATGEGLNQDPDLLIDDLRKSEKSLTYYHSINIFFNPFD